MMNLLMGIIFGGLTFLVISAFKLLVYDPVIDEVERLKDELNYQKKLVNELLKAHNLVAKDVYHLKNEKEEAA